MLFSSVVGMSLVVVLKAIGVFLVVVSFLLLQLVGCRFCWVLLFMLVLEEHTRTSRMKLCPRTGRVASLFCCCFCFCFVYLSFCDFVCRVCFLFACV